LSKVRVPKAKDPLLPPRAISLVEDVLGTDLKRRVAAKAGTDKFSGLELDRNGEGAPLIADWAAHCECAPVHMFDGGDHVIFQRFPPRAHRDNP